jgi:hypothetical protein
MARKPYVFTAHALDVMEERGIRKEWVVRILDEPGGLVDDRADPALIHAIGPIAEHGDRVLRVVYNSRTEPWRVVTVYFDRSLRDKP